MFDMCSKIKFYALLLYALVRCLPHFKCKGPFTPTESQNVNAKKIERTSETDQKKMFQNQRKFSLSQQQRSKKQIVFAIAWCE